MSLEELLNVTNVCKTIEIGEDAENEPRESKDLSHEKAYSRRRSERLSLEMLRAEAAEEDEGEGVMAKRQ